MFNEKGCEKGHFSFLGYAQNKMSRINLTELDRCKGKIGHFFDTFGQVSNFLNLTILAYMDVYIFIPLYIVLFSHLSIFFDSI